MNNTFALGHHVTIGAAFAQNTEKVTTRDGKSRSVIVQCWDTGGQERFRAISRAYFRGVHAAVLVYDASDSKSLDGLEKWKDDVTMTSPDAVFILVGAKCDLVPQISEERAMAWAAEHGITDHIRTSALTGDNVNEAFRTLAQRAVEKLTA